MGLFNSLLGSKDYKWKFIENGYGNESSLDSTDVETFKKDPIASIARELCQNSVDARRAEEPVKVEFKSFYLNTKDLPGINELKNEMICCRNSYDTGTKYYKKFDSMVSHLERDQILCLRVSDFNTKGLEGVATNDRNKAFYYLTKGNGLTTKANATSGGSKGIGKFASFVASDLQTVFYSTLNENNEEGYLGITKLASRLLNEETGMCTTGYGYYCSTEKVLPILDKLVLDKSFKREEFGTDVYIVDFRAEDNWKFGIITKVLDSFMVAIDNGDLIVNVDGTEISKETLRDVVYSNEISESEKRNIIGQYILLNDATVFKKEIGIKDYGSIKILLKDFNKQEEQLATNKCIMVRYPYMKITDMKIPFAKPCSAMCIIEKNELNSILRSVENPQHTDWEPNRIQDDVEFRREIKRIIKTIRNEVQLFANECLLSGDDKELDIDGASDYLADGEFGDTTGESEIEKTEKPKIINSRKAVLTNNVGDKSNVDDISNILDVGTRTEEGDETNTTEGHNQGSGGQIHEGENNTQGFDENGTDEILKTVNLSGIKAKTLILDRELGKYLISFVSIYDEPNCEMELFYLDDNGSKYKTKINKCILNGQDYQVDNNLVKNIKLEKNKMYKFELDTDLDDIYVCEVKLYANR